MTDLDVDELRPDFVGGRLGYGLRRGEARAHALVKASGIRADSMPLVADATAGLGRDAFLLASAGARVVLIERSARVHALLRDALAAAAAAAAGGAASPGLGEVVARMTLVFGDAREHLLRLRPDVVLVDPMHPPRRNSALVKKELRLLGQIVGADEDAESLMEAALGAARERVVLKWPLRAPPLVRSRPPSHQFLGKTVRYDVFMTRKGA